MVQQNWCSQIKDLIKMYPNVYTDIAYAVGNSQTHKAFLKDVMDIKLQQNIMFGTDFFLTERVLPEKDDYSTFKRAALNQAIGNTNAWEIMASKNVEVFLKSKYY